MESQETYWADLAALDWQVELGADEAIGDAPVDRYALPDKPKPQKAPIGTVPVAKPRVEVDPVAVARDAAAAAQDLESLADAMAEFAFCDLRNGARHLVFADGDPEARIMVISDIPDREEDRIGTPLTGDTGRLFDRMFAAIGMSRNASLPSDTIYVGACMPWRPPAAQDVSDADIAMLTPFLQRHIALVDPDILIPMGAGPCRMLLGKPGISRIRGSWQEIAGRPAMPMHHPRHLLGNPADKRHAWADLLSVKARLEDLA